MNGHKSIEIVFGLLVAVAGLAVLARKIRIAYPVVFVVSGLAMSFIPGLPRVRLDPDLVFFLFLPPLLYPAALLTSWRDFRANLGPIGKLASRSTLRDFERQHRKAQEKGEVAADEELVRRMRELESQQDGTNGEA